VDDGGSLGDLSTQFALFAAYCQRDGAPLYRRLAEGVAGDPAILALVGRAPPAQRRPLILLAAVHDLLLAGSDDPLAAHYPTVGAWRGERHGTAAGDPYAAFARFCARHGDRLAEMLATRATQTNEVGRCTGLVPALAEAARRAGGPLAVLDLGSAAGLNLLFDRYAYAYTGAGGTRVLARAGAEGSPVLLEAEVRHGDPPVGAMPPVVQRAGLDRSPVDLDDPERARWLLACQWPDHPDRFVRAARAIEVAQATPDRPRVHPGDMVDDLAAAADDAPPSARLCLLHTWVAAYLSDTDQRRLAAAVAELARNRPVSWLFAEQPYEVPGLEVPSAPGGHGDGAATAVVLVELDGPRRRAERLADMHPHGRWVRWWAGSG
jgi:hypothetical protein